MGILTGANQFVQLAQPELDVYKDNLVKINDSNYLVADAKIQTSELGDTDRQRETTVNNITLESDFYKFFILDQYLGIVFPRKKTFRSSVKKKA